MSTRKPWSLIFIIASLTLLLPVFAGASTSTSTSTYPAEVARTGQTTCYDASGTVVACTGTGQDGAIQAGAVWPNPRFVDNNNGTVTDGLTGLVWTKNGNLIATRDPAFDADNTAGDGAVTWQHALDYIKKLNTEAYLGYTDWRLPNVNELESLRDAQRINPSLPQGHPFTNVKLFFYWSSTSCVFSYQYVWVVYMYYGYILYGYKANDYSVWPVRAGQCGAFGNSIICLPKTGQTACYDTDGAAISCSDTGQDGELQKGVAWPSPRFVDNTDGTVIDSLTGLEWTKNANLAGGRMTLQQALDYVKTLTIGGHNDWRLPNNRELRSLADYSKLSPALPPGHPFTNMQSNIYWSSTSFVSSPSSEMVVDMYAGDDDHFGKTENYYILPVRSGQVVNPIISTTTTSVSTTTTVGDDYGNSCAAAYTVAVNTSVSGTINFGGDYDYFKIQTPSSGTLTVDTTGSTDTYGYLKDSACSTIESDDDDGEGNNFLITRTVAAGVYYVAVRHYSSSSTGAYTFNVVFAGQATTTTMQPSTTTTSIQSTSSRPTTTSTVWSTTSVSTTTTTTIGSLTMPWNTFVGSTDIDYSAGIAIDSSGNIYVAGESDATWGNPVNAFAGGRHTFVAKFNNNGSLLWNTFMGGPSSQDFACRLAIDSSGNIYVTGVSFATWGNPINSYMGGRDGFVAKLNSNGILLWNTFMGSTYDDEIGDIAIDSSDNLYVAGSGGSWGNPINVFSGGLDSTDAFVAKLNSSGTRLWNTFMGTEQNDSGGGIAVDSSGNVYTTGASKATWGNPIIAHAGSGFDDAFVAKLNSNGIRIWNTFMGATDYNYCASIAVDSASNVYVTGQSWATWGSPIHAFAGSTDVFAAKLNSSGTRLWNTFMGSANNDWSYDIAVDSTNNVYVTGLSSETWGSPIDEDEGNQEAYVAKLNSSGIRLWNTFMGSATGDFGKSIAVDSASNVYVTGDSDATWGSPINVFAGNHDVYVAKLSDGTGDSTTTTISVTTTTILPNSDTDHDGIPDSVDNCPNKYNPRQLDADGDGIGDVCDPTPGCGGCGGVACEQYADTDGDGIPDVIDNCPNKYNPQQLDADGDGTGDCCDATPGCGGCGGVACDTHCTP